MKAACLLIFLVPFAATLPAAEKEKAAPEKDPTCEAGMPPGKYFEKSIYRPGSTWTTDAGKAIKLDSLRGRPVVMTLFFTNCEHSCPFIVKDMKSVQSGLSKKARAKVDFVLVSIDPERDSTEALKAFRTKYHLTGARWTLLRSAPASVKELAEKIAFNYSPGSKTQFAHSVMITVLNDTGEVAHQQVGIGVDRRGAVATLEKLANSKSKH